MARFSGVDIPSRLLSLMWPHFLFLVFDPIRITPVLFPVAFHFDELFCCSFRVSFTGGPEASSLNIGCRGALGFSISKKRKQGPVLRAD